MSARPILLPGDAFNITRKRKRSNQLVASLIIVLSLFGVLGSGTIPPAHASAPPGAYFDHVVVIMMENEGVDNICGSHPPPCSGSNTPYMDSLANNFTLGVQYTSVIHPLSSEPNYVAVIGGSTFSCPSNCANINAPTLIDRFQSAGLTWKGYMESMQQPSGCDTSSSQEPYNNIHNPFISFSEFVQNGVPNAANCNNILLANPSTCAGVTDCALVNELNSGPSSVPNFMWLTPNDCNNMHATSGCANGCTSAGSSTCIKDGDSYLKSLVPNILNSNTFTSSRSALFITYDEGQDYCPLNGSSSEDCIYAVWTGPVAKNGFSTTSLFNHYSLTKTIETNWNLAALTSNDGNAQAMTAFFKAQAPDFTLSSSPSTLSFNAGSIGSFTVTVSAQNGFTGTVTLSPSSTPSAGLTVACNPSTMLGGAGSSSCTLNSSTPGTYTATVTGTSGSLSHSTSVTVTVAQPPKPDFAISANPSSLKMIQGSSGTSTISLTSLGGFSGTVSLSATVSPSGPGTSLNPASVTLASNGAGSSTLNVTSNGAPLGSYNVNVTGASSSLSHSTVVTLSVIQQPPPPDFSISASPSSLTLGGSASSSLSSVTVTASGDRTWFESSYLADSFYAQRLYWLFYEDSSVSCESMAGCLFYTTSSTGSSWATPTNVNVHVTDSDFSVYTDGSNVYYARYDEAVFQSDCGKNVYFRTGSLSGSGTINWQSEQIALKAGSQFTYENEEVMIDSGGQAWIALLSNSRGSCGGSGTELPQILHSSGTNYASWSTPFTLSTAHSNNWHIALVSLGSGQIYASFWLANADLHGRLFDGINWGSDEQISPTTTQNDVNGWLFNSGTNVYAIYFDNNPETFNFATRSSSGTWTTNVIGVGESRTGSKFSSAYYSFPDAASYDPTNNQFYLFWMNATLQRIDEWKGSGNTWTKTTKALPIAAAPYPDSITSFITSSPTNSFPTTGGMFYITGAGPFTINFAALPLSGSSTGTFTVTVASVNGFTGTVNLTTSVSPSTGLTATCSPTSISGGSGQSSCTVTGATAGSYNVTVTGTSGSLFHSASVSVVVQSPSTDFTISVSPSSLTLNSGATSLSTITVAPQNGFSGTVNLAVLTNSTNLTCSLSSSSIVGGSGTSTLSCRGSSAGNYLATVTGTSGTLSHSATVTNHVQDFAIASNPSSVSTTIGASGTSTVVVSSINGFASTVSLAVATNSTNLSCILSTARIAGGAGSSTLSCTSNTTGNYLATLTGTNNTLSHSVTVNFHVKAAPDFTVSASPTSITQNVGVIGNSTITIAPANGFSGAVSLVVTTNSTSLHCTLTQTSVSGGSGSSTLSCNGSPAGNYLATVTGTNGTVSRSATVTCRIQDFALEASPSSEYVGVGVAGNATITVSSLNGFSGTTNLAVTANSTALVCSLSNPIVTGSGTSSLSCTGAMVGNYLASVTGTSSNVAHASNVVYHIITVPAKDFTISVNPTNLVVDSGSLGNSTVTVTPVNGFSGTVTLSVSTNSTSLICTLSQAIVNGGSGKSILSCRGSPFGNYLANVTGTSGSLSHSATVTIQVADFTVSSSPTDVTVQAYQLGQAKRPPPGNSTVTIDPQNGFARNLAMSFATNSTNISCTLSPTTIIGGSGSSTLSCISNAAGSYLATVTATDGALSRSTTVTYHVQDFTIAAAPSVISERVGIQGNSTVSVASLNGFAGTVTLSVATTSANLSCHLTSTSISGASGTSTLSCSASVQGKYNATVSGTSGNASHSVVVVYSLTAPDFTVSAGPISISMVQGSSGTSNVTLASVNGFSGSVSLTASISPTGLGDTFNPPSVALISSGTGSSTLNITSSGASPGIYSVNVTAASGSLSHSIIIRISVTSIAKPSPYSLVVSYEGFVYKLFPNNTLVQIGQPVTTQLSVVAWRPDGSCAIIAGNAGVLIKYDGTSLTIVPTGVPTSINLLSAAWRPDGSFALVGGSGGVLLKYDCNTVTQVSNSFSVSFRALSWRPDGSQALLVSYFGKIYQYSSSTGSIIQLTSPTGQSLDAVAWNPNGSYALLAGSGGAVLRYDGNAFQVLDTAGAYSSTLTVRYVSFNPTGSLALLVGDSGLVVTYDGTTMAALQSATTSTLYSVSWSNGTTYIVGGSGTLVTYSAGVETKVSIGSFSGFRSIAWKP